jgi:hypothetical protein
MNNYLNFDLLSQDNLLNIKKNLSEKGYYSIENVFNEQFCSDIITFIRTKSAGTFDSTSEITTQYAGTEIRLWDSQNENKTIMNTKIYLDKIYTDIFRKKYEAYTVLAMYNKPIEESFLRLGRWHIDSYREQYKIFIYLTDVDYENGPFEFIPDTASFLFKSKMFFTGRYFALKDFFTNSKGRRYSKLKDDWIEKSVKNKYNAITFTCKAGTILFANTSCIHRAIPCMEGERITLTCYY